ncbi:MAG: IS66 family transposase [Blautia faecis]
MPVPRETAAHWYNYCASNYLLPVYEALHRELLKREVLHADEVPCQVLHEEGKSATSKSYMWIYLSGTDGLPPVILYDYRPGRSGDHPIEFLSGFTGMLHCDGYAAYGRIEDVVLVCCLAHCRRKFFEAVPKARQKNLKLLDINSEQEIPEPPEGTATDEKLLPAEKGVAFCNRLFYLERLYKGFPADERRKKRQEKEPAVWNEFWSWLDTLEPAGGSKLEKAVNYALNHKDTLMNYLLDGRCEISNNAAERRAKTYVTGRKNFLFHDTTNGAMASAIVLSIIETAKANGLNIFQYLYTLLLYMPDYKDEPAGIEQLMPWSEFIKERCTGITDIENVRPENRGNLNI